jgi:hypothetical protein
MDCISRRQVVRGAAGAAAMAVGTPAVHAQKGQRTLSFVAEADLKILFATKRRVCRASWARTDGAPSIMVAAAAAAPRPHQVRV